MADKNKNKKQAAEKLSKNNEINPAVSPTTHVDVAGTAQTSKPLLVPVTAIGASAGGLDPIEQFFDSMPVDSGSAFVIIQHLSPDFKSLMDELLARHSSMKIKKIEDGMEIEPNSIYLNTPRTVMTIDGNHLRVEQVDPKELVYLPIDIFFKSLAANRGAGSIGIVLSGTGSDGTKGSTYISEAGGNVLVQDPSTTRFDGMPRSAMAGGKSTLSAPPKVLAECVAKLLKNEPIDVLDTSNRLPISDPLADVLSMLKHSHGTDFAQYKDATIHRRIERRAQMRGSKDINDYRDLLSVDNFELQDLYADLLIEVTEFFRDQEAFEVLEKTVIPKLIDNLQDGAGLRVWVPGCASGEEAYSIAILLQEYARKRGMVVPLKIMASDIHVRSMSQASSGIYEESALKYVPKELVERYFDSSEGQAQIKPQLRNMVFFSTHDVTYDPPFTRIDLISCRNLLIYLKEDAQAKVMNLLHFSLRKDGYLFLGPSEHIGAISHEFESVSDKWRVYKKLRDVKLLIGKSIFHRSDLGDNVSRKSRHAPFVQADSMPTDDSIPFKRAHRAALENIVEEYAPPGFLLSEDGVVVHIFGSAGDLIPLQSGTFSRKLVALIKPELKVIVTTALDHGRHRDFSEFRRIAYVRDDTEEPVSYEIKLSKVDLPGETVQFQLLTVQKIVRLNDEIQQGSVVSQAELAAYDSSEVLHQRISTLELNLQSSEESLQSTIEELETSNEELQSTNEELMSTNEELQSTNEELHSVNEELYTVSAEHQRKNEDLTEKDADIDILLRASKIGTIHLDDELRLRRFTNNARSVFNILPQDIGRPIQHITIRAAGENILEMVERVNTGHDTLETQISIDDAVYLLRIMPYRPQPSQPSGVLITVIDVTDLESVNAQLATLDIQYKDIVEKTDTSHVRWDAKTGRITFCNEPFARRWDKPASELIETDLLSLYTGEERNKFSQLISGLQPNELKSIVNEHIDYLGNEHTMQISVQAISDDGVETSEYQANGQNLTQEVNYRKALEQLSSSFTDNSLDFNEKTDRLLKVGCDYFKLESGSLGVIADHNIQIRNICGKAASDGYPSDSVALSETFSGMYFNRKPCFSLDSVSQSGQDLSVQTYSLGVESYIGATVHNASGPYGTVDFYSTESRHKKYDAREESFAMLIGSWIGYLVEHQEQAEFLSEQTEHYKSLFNNVPVMMMLCDEHGLVLSASNRLCDFLLVKPDELPGKSCLDVLDVNDKESLKAALSEGNVDSIPFILGNSNGENIDIELNSNIKPFGTLQGVRMMVLIDVSERNAALNNAENQNRNLELANKSLNQFAFVASHDLQEPLRKIQQFSSVLEEDAKDQLSEDAQSHLNTIVDASKRMSTLIRDLLAYSRASNKEPKKQIISLNQVLKDVQEDLQLLIAESNATIVIGDLPDVDGDLSPVRQLFTNLVNNSLKYHSEDRPCEITVEAYSDNGRTGVIVCDNGIGFEMKFAKKIFEPFNRLHGSKEYKGSGIGLAICTMVCQKHNWHLSVQSEVGVGSTFTIEFSDK